MRHLLETASQLNRLKDEFNSTLRLKFPAPLEIDKLIKKIDVVEGKFNNEKIEDIDFVWKKVSSMYFKYGNISAISVKEKKKYPFLLGYALKTDYELYNLLLNDISKNTSQQVLRREIVVYFQNYGTGRYDIKLKNDILSKLKTYNKYNSFLLNMKNNSCFFRQCDINLVREECISRGLFNYFLDMHFPKSILYSNYVREVIKGIFDFQYTQIGLAEKIALFLENYSNLLASYTDLLPHIFSSLILQIDICTLINKEKCKEDIRIRALEFMGDPRLNHGNFNRWYIAGEKAEITFIRWISQYDLGAFFDVISRSLNDATARRMWRYRERFWKSYKNDIEMVWVCFGNRAKYLARKGEMSYGSYIGVGDDNKSCLLIVMGNYIFVERSHNGRLKVWRKRNCPFKIGDSIIYERNITNAIGLEHFENGNLVDGWTHSSSETFSWQKKVGNFIMQYIRVLKTVHDW